MSFPSSPRSFRPHLNPLFSLSRVHGFDLSSNYSLYSTKNPISVSISSLRSRCCVWNCRWICLLCPWRD
ncbi:hypothetical protein PENTCL1PPCAC_2605 [Pristionchus entomophagus]|uniref:Uncharacterized protein n=1 Tax=Pristionchus entomophagus TaxID=358040 RepID=A0AAV5SJU5_9BILA|nr:hypothetical protein PENTCL1PPCAC_2605 [Pristionchus entomophagus]